VGVDHRRPLAAFVLLAVVAAILLVTSVRSNADTGESAGPPGVVAGLVAPPQWSMPGLLARWVLHDLRAPVRVAVGHGRDHGHAGGRAHELGPGRGD
jgi:hypothetical protein